MSTTIPPAGDSWPTAQYGEVYGPTGKRCYLARQASRLAGRTSDKWARDLVITKQVQGEREAGGHRRWFLHADSFEAHGRGEGWWPPAVAPSASGQATWELLVRQGHDLERLRKELVEAAREQDALRKENADLKTNRKELLDIVQMLARLAKQD